MCREFLRMITTQSLKRCIIAIWLHVSRLKSFFPRNLLPISWSRDSYRGFTIGRPGLTRLTSSCAGEEGTVTSL